MKIMQNILKIFTTLGAPPVSMFNQKPFSYFLYTRYWVAVHHYVLTVLLNVYLSLILLLLFAAIVNGTGGKVSAGVTNIRVDLRNHGLINFTDTEP
jgi:hypothetical protein